MGWSLGFDSNWNRWIGYGVPAYCDYPGCNEKIDRGLNYICGGEPYGGNRGCGLYFCEKHLIINQKLPQLCDKCNKRLKPFKPKKEHPEWIKHLLTDQSWKEWREENKDEVDNLVKLIKEA
jgi:hypothetical protein